MTNATLTKNTGKALKKEAKEAYKALNEAIESFNEFGAREEFSEVINCTEWLYRLRNRLHAAK